ncbi:MAG: hypothetical protein ACHQO8_10520 [Vicinamibacterales bacterium]
MPDLIIDRVPVTLESGPKTWAELLAAVDWAMTNSGRAVTAVRFEGVDQPSFRDADLGSRLLDGLHRIEVESLDTRALIQMTVVTALDSLTALDDDARRVAGAFRGVNAARASGELPGFVSAIRHLSILTATLGDAAGVDLDALHCGQRSVHHLLDGVTGALDRVVGSQQAEDWIAAADSLEYELAPSLTSWRSVFDAIGERCAA